MKVSVKTLKGVRFKIEAKPDDTVADVKKIIEADQGADVYPAAQQMLIHQGKVLADGSTLAESKVVENSFIVVMLSKSKTSGEGSGSVAAATKAPQTSVAPTPSAAAAAAPTPSPSPTPASVAPAPSPSPAPAPIPAGTPGTGDVYGQAASNLVAGNNLEGAIQQILDMGGGTWDRDTVVRALRAAFNNPERAVEYLYSAYVQQLENSRLRLLQLEQELERVRQQDMFASNGISGDHHSSGSGAAAFDMEYNRWLDEHQCLINELRSAVNTQMSDNELRVLVDAVMAHHEEIFRLKRAGTKADVFHMLSGMWKTPAERCFMWLGGFRSSEMLKVLRNHLEPLTEQQLLGIYNLQQSSQQAEGALSQGMEALQQSLADKLSSTTMNSAGSGNVTEYMKLMASAMGKLATLENFLQQADLLRLQTLQQLHRILTTRQAARALLGISDYTSRLRALSSLWLARPRD